jgi:hypothetical protein
MNNTDRAKTFSVLVMDRCHYLDKDEETMVGRFQTFEAARECARRRTRDSVAEQRPASTNLKALRGDTAVTLVVD